ncbi:hypothetical protein [Clostridium tagluense]|uniref:Uncharacterized protein n=1 Tax=Clostridium tagluense TaxID=360422 RepID=A0A401UQL0_9CLOT|nr:hypothetical protein [Clostridium tagluense]GCD11778.1 hypothetical protein Ctaglu_34010 [Clostridium tagluense]
MAGLLKPIGVSKEGVFVVNDCHCYFGSDRKLQKNGLFDGIVGAYDTANAFYWYEASDFLNITINQKSNIWVFSGISGTTSNGDLDIKKWDGTVWNNFSIPQVRRSTNANEWTKTISDLPEGMYRFSYGGGYRIDIEWYIEAVPIKRYLIQNETNDLFTVNGGLVNLGAKITTEDLYITKGFSDVTLLNGTTFNQTKTMKDEGVIGTGKMFSVDIDTSMIKNINIT